MSVGTVGDINVGAGTGREGTGGFRLPAGASVVLPAASLFSSPNYLSIAGSSRRSAQMAASTQPVLIELTESPDMSTPETESKESPDEPTRDPETYGAAHVSTALVIVGIACGVIAPIAVPRSAVALEQHLS